MLIVAGLIAVVVTVLEILVLSTLVPVSATFLAVLIGANLALFSLVAYLVFTSIRVPRPAPPTSARAVRVVGDTLPLLRRGLNPDTAAHAARVMATFEGVGAVVIADQTGILATGGGMEEKVDQTALKAALARVMESRRGRVVKIGGYNVALTALQSRGKPLGALGLIGDASTEGQKELTGLARVLGQLLSMQVELGQMDRQAQLVAEAELNALRAQINPHFLFNALNTIISYSRDDPQMTRRLLLRLADLFRGSMQSSGQRVPFADEYEQIKNYLYIEQARFRDRLNVVYDIDPQVLKIEIPALSVQPLVENAVRHGLAPKTGPGTIILKAWVDFLTLRVIIRVSDDGVGMEPGVIPELLRPRAGRKKREGGLGLANINERLRRLYGEGFSLGIESAPGRGTSVTMRIPMR